MTKQVTFRRRLKKTIGAENTVKVKRALQKILSFYHFHSWARFRNYIEFHWRTNFGDWSPMQLHKSVLQRVFYILVDKESRKVLKIPYANNQFSDGLVKRLRFDSEFELYRDTLLNSRPLRGIRNRFPSVEKVRKDGGYKSQYIEGITLSSIRHQVVFEGRNLDKEFSSKLVTSINSLLTDLKALESSGSALVGDWALHNLVYCEPEGWVYNVDIEGLYSIPDKCLENDLKFIENSLRDLTFALKASAEGDFDDRERLRILRVISEIYSEDSTVYSGQQFLVGYHTLTLNEVEFTGQRNCSSRFSRIPYELNDKTVVDFGCNVGGMLHAIRKDIACGIGFDFDMRCINAANSIKSLNGADNLEFYQFDLEAKNFTSLVKLLPGKKVDICFLLSVCMWIENWEEVLENISFLSPRLLFESNGSQEQQDAQIKKVHSLYRDVSLINESSADDPLQGNRSLYFCENSLNYTV